MDPNRALENAAGEDVIEVLSARPEWIALRLPCTLGAADRLVQFFRQIQARLTDEEQNNVVLAFRELLINAVEHGGQLDPKRKVEISYIRTSRAILYCVRDPGKGFSFETLTHAAVSNAPGDPIGHVYVRMEAGLRPGGFGILLARNLADEVIYNENCNEVLLVKHIHTDPKG